MPVVAYTSTASGYFSSGAMRARDAYENPVSRQRLTRTQALARELNVSSGQVALAWLMHQPFPVFPIVGTCNVDHLREALGAAGVCLTDEHVEHLAARHL